MNLQELLNLSVKLNASDLHLSPGAQPTLRIDGELTPVKNAPILDAKTIEDFVFNVMDQSQRDIFERERELDFTVVISEMASFRVNAFHQIFGIAAVFRVIAATIPTLETLGIPSIFKQILELSSGLILITGPTGCGKSSTLAAMIEYINTHKANHVITIEDPIEFVHRSKKSIVNQRQVYRDTATFHQALRASLREDPDIILVGEMRDLETIRLALTAAETGHLVMATLHTSSAPRTISRIIDVFPAGEKNIIRNQLSESLRAVVCQTLVKKIDGGRVAAFEIMLGTAALRNLIREDKTAQMYSMIQTSGALGMCTMEQSLQMLVANKVISPDVASEGGFQRELFERW